MGTIEEEARKGRAGGVYFRFTPGRAVAELRLREPSYSLSKPWAAMGLIFWALLDGRPGKREDTRRSIYSSDARRAGNILLLNELRRASANKDTRANNEFAEIMRMFEDTGGFANAIVGYPAAALLEECRDNEPRIRLALEIVKYLVRRQSLPKEKQNIEEAKYFVANWPGFEDCLVSSAEPERGKKTARGVKTLEKIWAEFSAASPYLFALYSDPAFEATIFNDLDQTIDWVKSFAANAERVNKFLGIAASVTDVLSEMSVRKHRGKDFRDVARVPLSLPPYSVEQIEKISTQDRHAEEKKKDDKDWRPGMKNEKR
jgi:hypothetical protein